MRKIITSLAVVAFAATGFSQSTTVTQSNDPNSVSANGSVACGNNAGGYTSDNYYSRAFKLSNYGVTGDFTVTEVRFGVQTASTTLPVTINLYNQTSGTYPAGTKSLLKSFTKTISPADVGTVVSATTNQVVPAGATLVTEFFHDGQDEVQVFYFGTNAAGQTAPSYLKSEGCGIMNPIATGTGALAGFASAQWVISVVGTTGMGTVEVLNSQDVKIYPNPVRETLNFGVSKGLSVDSFQIIDASGKVVKSSDARSKSSVDVSSMAKGVYILKAKLSDGKVHVQKIVKE